MKVYTKQDKAWGILRTDCPPKVPMALGKGLFIFTCIVAAFTFFFLIGNDFGFLGSLTVAAFTVGLGSLGLVMRNGAYRAWERFCEEMRQHDKEHEDEYFYIECKENGISTLNLAGIARMKIIAKQMRIVCSDDELTQKYLKGKAVIDEKKQLQDAEEKKNRLARLRKEEQAKERECKRYIHLSGVEKRIKQCADLLANARMKLAKLEGDADAIIGGTEAIYSHYSEEETDWAVHGGIASAIAGPAAGVAVAADIQRKNAEIRASNAQLRQATNQFAQPLLLDNIQKEADARRSVKNWENELEKAKLKLVEEHPQGDLLNRLSPKIIETKTSETGAITITVSVKKATMTIYKTVSASVDGTFKVQIMDGERFAGEAYFTLPYGGARSDKKLTSICASLPDSKKNYTFVFKPHNLCAIEL